MPAENLPFADGEFELASAIEVLEHVPDPEHTLAEMARCAERHLLVSVPREPLWRVLNIARGAYLRAARQHARPPQPLVQALVRRPALALRRGRRDALAVPLDDVACPPLAPASARRQRAPTGAARASCRSASPSTGLLTFAYFSIASHVLGEQPAKRIDLLWSVMFVIISVIYRPIEQLLSRTIAERRARGHAAAHAARADADPGRVRARLPRRSRSRCTASSSTTSSNTTKRSTIVLVVGTLAYAASYFARGWLAGHERFGLFGGLVLMESVSRVCFALAVARRHRRAARRRSRSGSPPRRSSRSSSSRSRSRAPAARGSRTTARRSRSTRPTRRLPGRAPRACRRRRRTTSSRCAAAAASRRRSRAIMLSEQTLLNAAVLTVDATSPNRALAGIVFNVLLIARAPLQLFQAIQTSLLPHLTGLEATAGHDAFARAIRIDRARDRRVRRVRRARAAARRPVRARARLLRPALQLRSASASR